MKKLIFLFCLYSLQLFSQITFEKSYSLFQNPQIYFVQELNDGGFILCGKSINILDSTTDFCFFKTDLSGNVIWEKQLEDNTVMHGYPTDEWATTIREKMDGSFVFGGCVKDPDYNYSEAFYGWLDSYGTLISSATKSTTWSTSVNALLLNTNGKIVSTRDDNEGAGHHENQLEINSSTAKYISGSSTGNFSLANQSLVKMPDDGYGTIAIDEDSYTDPAYSNIPVISRFDSDGTVIWRTTVNMDAYTSKTPFKALCATLDTGLLVCGYVKSGNIFVTKFNMNGDSVWTKNILVTGIPISIQQTTDGGFAILGTLISNIFLLKLNESCDIVWLQTYNNSLGNASGIYFQQTSDDGFILLGHIENSGPETIYLIKTDSKGNANTITKTGKVDPIMAFNLYPDPFPSSINVDIPGNRSCTFSLSDLAGRIVYRKIIAGETNRVDLSFLPSGIYCAFIVGDEKVRPRILMKQ